MLNIPMMGAMAPTPDMLPKKKRDWRASLFDRLNPDDQLGLGDSDKSKIGRQALLGLASGLLSTGGGFGNALGAGIQQGLLSMNQGADDVANDRYRQAMMARTMQGAERNAKAEELSKRAFNPDGSPNMPVLRELASFDAATAKSLLEFGQPEQDKWTPYDITDPSNPNNVISAMHNGRGQWQYPDGTPLFDQGPLAGAAASAQPQFGITSDAPAVPAAAGPMMGQAFYDEIGKLISPYGATVGSTNGGQHNPGSLHYDGRALDIPLGASATDAVRANADRMVADLSNRGFKVRDERTRPEGQAVWGGPHLHVEAPTKSAAASQNSRFSRPRYKPEGGDSGARYRTMTPDEVKQYGLPAGTVAQMSPTGQIQIVNKPRDLPTGGQTIENPDGSTTFIPAGKITEGERNAAGFYERMVSATSQMDKLTGAGYDPTNLRDFATTGRTATNFAASTEGQQYYQAAMNWVRANLRKESGAAIGVDEARQEIRNYFPQPGDSKEVVAQKAEQRKVVEAGMRKAAGGALPPMVTPQSDRAKSNRLKFNPKTGKLE